MALSMPTCIGTKFRLPKIANGFGCLFSARKRKHTAASEISEETLIALFEAPPEHDAGTRGGLENHNHLASYSHTNKQHVLARVAELMCVTHLFKCSSICVLFPKRV